ncbi:MAG: hypothetical protein LIP12_00955 [Clostridiales bacterium]|nr:hypothetical protein [Clostridiales bacterium]
MEKSPEKQSRVSCARFSFYEPARHSNLKPGTPASNPPDESKVWLCPRHVGIPPPRISRSRQMVWPSAKAPFAASARMPPIIVGKIGFAKQNRSTFSPWNLL